MNTDPSSNSPLVGINLLGLDLSGIRIQVLDYNENEFSERTLRAGEKIESIDNGDTITWINMDGHNRPEILRQICQQIGVHPLVQDDILNTKQRPKIEDYGEYLFMVIRMLEREEVGKDTRWEQVSIILGDNFVISFQIEEGDIFDPIREQIRNKKGKIREMGADYLAYKLVDAVVDECFLVLEDIDNSLDELEEKLLNQSDESIVKKIYRMKRELVRMKKAVWPLQQLVPVMRNSKNDLITEELQIYLQDLHDHVIRVIESVETYRETTSSMIDLYLSTSSIKMNEVIKVLTVISTVFIPLTFITGFYGMNLDFMPEVHSKWSYPVIVAIMGILVVLQLLWFRKKKWI